MNKSTEVKMEWISIKDELPQYKQTVEYASHQTYGIAYWEPDKGFTKAYLTCGPWEDPEFFDSEEYPDFLNMEVMYWRPIPDWPNRGTRGCDSLLMQNLIGRRE